jgi:phospholipid/cholesterol/gamma-HCH transport system substrate-binding protein
VGLFIIIAVSALALIMILMGLNQRWFAKDYYFTSRFLAGNGLTVGMPITLKGFEIGKVKKIDLNANYEVDVIFYIYDTHYDKVKPNSVLELSGSALGFGGGLLFHPGKNSFDPLPEESFIPSLDFPEGRMLVRNKLIDIPVKEDVVTALLNKADPIMNNVLEITSTIDTITKSVDELLKIVNLTLEGRHSGPIAEILNDVKSISTKADENIMTSIDGILADVNAIIAELNSFTVFLNSTNPQISVLLEESKIALTEGKAVLEGVKNNPLIRGGITPLKPQPSTFTGLRDGDF